MKSEMHFDLHYVFLIFFVFGIILVTKLPSGNMRSSVPIGWTGVLVAASSLNDEFSSDSGSSEKSIATTLRLDRDFPVCSANDLDCIRGQEKDRLSFEAIKTIHRQIDDDLNGNVDLSESDEFLRDELQYEDDFDRHNVLHRGGDKFISIDDLWRTWVDSDVYNWTVDETVSWLVEFVELPQYAETFQHNAISGSALPRLAVNSAQFMQSILGITDPIHRQKIALKAMDAVLFGPPKPMNSYMKDWILVISLVVAMGGCWFAFVQQRYSKCHILNELESLQKAEDSLREMQEKLEEAREEHQSTVREKQSIEAKLHDEIAKAMQEAERLRQARGDGTLGDQTAEDLAEKLQLAEDELVQVRCALQEAERQLDEMMGWSPPTLLQQWLQLTHEIESKYYNSKKQTAERQLLEAKEVCMKIRRKRGTFMGAFKMAHSSAMDEMDTKLEEARSILTEVTMELKERMNRWGQIEMLCNFPIVNNPGFLVLAGALGLQNYFDQAAANFRVSNLASIIGSTSHLEHNTQRGVEEGDDDIPTLNNSSTLFPQTVRYTGDLTQMRAPAVRQMRNTSSMGNLSLLSQGNYPAKLVTPMKPARNPPTGFYLGDSPTSEGSRPFSDHESVSHSTPNSNLPSPDTEHVSTNNKSTLKEQRATTTPALSRAVMKKTMHVSNSESSLQNIVDKNGKTPIGSKGSPRQSLEEEDACWSSDGTGSDMEEKKKRRKFPFPGRKSDKEKTKAS